MWVIIYSFVIALVVPILKVALRALGIGGITFIGFNFLLDTVVAQMQLLIGGLPAAVLEILTLAGFFEIVSLLVSALAIRLLVMGVSSTSDSVSRFRATGSGDVF